MEYIDKPIETVKNDFLGRSKFAKDLAKAISSYDEKDSLVLGLMGQWGSGKTSIINLLEEEMKENLNSMTAKQIITIKFEPWNISNQDNLISQFFATIISELNGKSKLKTIKRIAVFARKAHDFTISMFKKLVNLVGSVPITPDPTLTSLTMSAKVLGPLLKNYEAVVTGTNKKDSLIGLKKKIEEQLKKLDAKFLIVIDDIDRLNSNEVCQIFQLVKAVADFPNTIYLLSFDRETVKEALEKGHVIDGVKYLEKIIQIPFEIPMAPLSKVREKFCEEVLRITKINGSDQYFQVSRAKVVFPFLEDARKMYRLLALYRFKHNAIGEDVNETDLLNICAIEIFNPVLYNWIKRYKGILTADILIDYPHEWWNNDLQTRVYAKKYADRLEDYLDLSALNNEINKEIIEHLFPNSYFIKKDMQQDDTNEVIERLKNELRIASPIHFDRYFTLNLATNDLTKKEQENLTVDAKKEDVLRIINYDLQKTYDYMNYILYRTDDTRDDEGRVKELIAIMLELGSYSVQNGKLKKDKFEDDALESEDMIPRRYKAMDVIFSLLENVKNEDDRFNILMEELQTSKPPMFELFKILFNQLEFEHGYNDGTTIKIGKDKPLLKLEDIKKLKEFQDKKEQV